MKLEINLDQISIDDYGETVAGIIKDEIRMVVHNEVRALVKAHKETLAKSVQKAMASYLSNIPSAEDLLATVYKRK
jgi:hypothetical protein